MTYLPGLGTLINVAAIVVGSLVGMGIGHRFPEHVRLIVTDVLGLVTLLVAALSAVAVTDAAFTDSVGTGAPTLIVLGSLIVGSMTGSWLRIEQRLGSLADWVHAHAGGTLDDATSDGQGTSSRERFIEGWLSSSLLFCVGPLTILGSLSDGMGNGIEQLTLKAVLDGFAAMAFASTFGLGVMLSAVSVLITQGGLTAIGYFVGQILSVAQVASLTATGGLMLAGLSMRLLRIREMPVGDMLPALIVAPILTYLVTTLRGG